MNGCIYYIVCNVYGPMQVRQLIFDIGHSFSPSAGPKSR